MNRRIDKLIPKAIEAAGRHLSTEGIIHSEYNGYISSFGSAVLQSGLKAAIAFNESESSGSAKDKRPLMRAILELVTKTIVEKDSKAKLLDHVLSFGENTSAIKDEIMDAATALKLAIRTFKLDKKEGE